jgi:hypothetical protein
LQGFSSADELATRSTSHSSAGSFPSFQVVEEQPLSLFSFLRSRVEHCYFASLILNNLQLASQLVPHSRADMPIRVKSRPAPAEAALRTPSPMGRQARFGAELPDIRDDDSFRVLVKKLSIYIADVILLPVTFEQLRTTGAGDGLRTLVDHLGRNCTHPAIVNALL